MKFLLSFSILLTFSFSAFAEAPLKFKAWRESQVLEAQNEVLRISSRLHQQKANPKKNTVSSADEIMNSSRFESALEVTDKDLKSAQENLASARELSLEDYADVYVANLREQDPDLFSKLMDSLSKEELAQLMKILVKNKSDDRNDALHNKAQTAPLAAISAAHS